MTVARA